MKLCRLHNVTLSATIGLAAVAAAVSLGCQEAQKATPTLPSQRPQAEERLSFQTQESFDPRVNLNADVAMVYGIDKTLPERLATWKARGYIPEVMTGVSWGEYQDYYYGRFDGKNHLDEAQMQKNGDRIGHGGDVYYMAPSEAYGRFLSMGVKRALDAGAQGIYLEEPEIWVRSGWEEGFKREWQSYYGEAWIEPDSSPDAQYRASKLKYFLYRRTLSQIFDFVKAYAKEHNRDIKCYVPTHSMLNYANWGIVSPESSLLDVGADGYIAQVWTGTARTPNFYAGIEKERTFETAFLEYNSMQNLVRASGKRVWYLNDPIEDNANHSWFDYRTNWESTLIASLLQPEVYRYEIMPWPHRIFEKKYPSTQPVTHNTPRVPIPQAYETELQAVITAMGDLKQPDDQVKWLAAGTAQTGVLVADTMMFQRFGPGSSDSRLGNFYGLSLPLLMHGIPVEPVQIETAQLSRYKVLLLTYEGQKPPKPEFHKALADWVKAGGALVVIDNDQDPFNKVREWWNTGDRHYTTPREHLFEELGLNPSEEGQHAVGKGVVVFKSASPAGYSRSKSGAEAVRLATQQAMTAIHLPWQTSSALVLKRGPYIVAAGLESTEGVTPAKPLTGRLVSLFDSKLEEQSQYTVTPGSRALLLDVNAAAPKGVIAAACRVTAEKHEGRSIQFDADGQAESKAVVLVKVPGQPKSVTLNGQPIGSDAMDYRDGLLRLRFDNMITPQHIDVNW